MAISRQNAIIVYGCTAGCQHRGGCVPYAGPGSFEKNVILHSRIRALRLRSVSGSFHTRPSIWDQGGDLLPIKRHFHFLPFISLMDSRFRGNDNLDQLLIMKQLLIKRPTSFIEVGRFSILIISIFPAITSSIPPQPFSKARPALPVFRARP